jgi:hypothetical protein
MKYKVRAFIRGLATFAATGALVIVLGPRDQGGGVSVRGACLTETAVAAGLDPQVLCQSLATFREDVVGFIVKRPAGWRIMYTTGVITVLKDDKAREGVLIYPIRPKAGFTLQEFASSYLNVLRRSPAGSSLLDYSDLTADRSRPTAKVMGTMGGKTILGSAAAVAMGPDYVLMICWAPAEEFSSKQGLLQCIAESYQRIPGLALVRLSGNYFETMAPKGWKILEETSNSVNFKSPAGDAGVMGSYMDFGGDVQPMTIPRLFEALTKPCVPGQQPCYSITRTYTRLGGVDAPDFNDTMGRTWKARAEEFDATLVDAARTKVHGVLTGMVMCGRHVTGLYGWITATVTRISSPDAWEKNSAATAIVQENLKIIKASELITRRILPRNNPYDSSTIMGSWEYKNRVDSELSAKRREAIMGYETYRTPSGERVDVPLNSIPGGNNPLYYNPQTGTTWSSTLDPPPQGYYLLRR